MLSVYFATLNDHKIHEVSKILAQVTAPPVAVQMHTAASLNLAGAWQESGKDFAENAKIKAEFVRAALAGDADKAQACVLAEDSGICVAALEGRPGIHSKRYSGVTGPEQDAANNAKLLAELASADDRRAHYHCALAFWHPKAGWQSFAGEVHGQIATEARGTAGFGYDPLFVAAGQSKTFGELPEAAKLTMSHRYVGIRAFAHWLRAEGLA